MKKAKIVIADNEDGEGWFIYRVDYVTEKEYEWSEKSHFINGDSLGIIQGRGIIIDKQ